MFQILQNRIGWGRGVRKRKEDEKRKGRKERREWKQGREGGSVRREKGKEKGEERASGRAGKGRGVLV